MKKEIVKELLDKFYVEYHTKNFNEAISLLKEILLIEKKGSF